MFIYIKPNVSQPLENVCYITIIVDYGSPSTISVNGDLWLWGLCPGRRELLSRWRSLSRRGPVENESLCRGELVWRVSGGGRGVSGYLLRVVYNSILHTVFIMFVEYHVFSSHQNTNAHLCRHSGNKGVHSPFFFLKI